MARVRIGDLMVKAGLIDELQLQAALAQQRQWGGRLGDILVTQGFIDEMMLWKGLAHQLQAPLVSLQDQPLTPAQRNLVPRDLCERYGIIGLSREGRCITVASSEPNHLDGIDELAFRLGCRLQVVLAPAREIEWAIRKVHHGEDVPCPPPRVKVRGDDTAPAETVQHERARAEPGSTQTSPPTALGAPPGTSAAELARALAGAAGAAGASGLVPDGAIGAASGPMPGALAMAQSAISQANQQLMAAPGGASRQEVEAALWESAHLLRFLVDACIQRGLFSRADFLARLQR